MMKIRFGESQNLSMFFRYLVDLGFDETELYNHNLCGGGKKEAVNKEKLDAFIGMLMYFF